MLKYRGAGLIRAGFIGVVLVALIIAVGLSPKSSRNGHTVRYQALFADAGGIATGNDVTVSGIKVGSVTDMSLQRGEVLMTFTVNGNVQLGSPVPHTSGPARCWANGCSPSIRGRRHPTSDGRHPGDAHLLAVFFVRGRRNLASDIQEPTRQAQQSLDTCREH